MSVGVLDSSDIVLNVLFSVFALFEFSGNTYTAVEVVFAHDLLHPLGGGPDEGRGVQVVELVEVEEGGKVGEHLVPDPVAGLVSLLDLVDDVVADLGVLADAEDVVALDGGRVPDEEHPALPLRHEEVRGILP